MIVVNNEKLLDLIKSEYKTEDIHNLNVFLEKKNTFNFSPLDNGLFSAAILKKETEYTGYSSVWVRDNIHLAHTHYVLEKIDVATKNVNSLMNYFKKYQWRFENIIEGKIDPDNVMERPHIRFDGHNLQEIDRKWEHAQNDALGYFLWFYCKLARKKLLKLQPDVLRILALFPLYFQKIHYWKDEDSGHWEEERKIEASSIGTVVAGLLQLKQLLTDNDLASHCKYKDKLVTVEFLEDLIDTGKESLDKILPAESIEPETKKRQYDAALLFLIYPLKIVEKEKADRILSDVIENLQENYGIRRYLGDSFWCRNYKKLPKEIRTSISSDREQWFKDRNQELKKGEEAEWCIFDPIISIIFGIKFQKTHNKKYLEQQTQYLNRSLGQLTNKDCEFGEFKCPELYYIQNDRYIPNDATPLLWTQGNLIKALKIMELSCKLI